MKRIEVKLTKEQKEKYIFVFGVIENKHQRLLQEHDMLLRRFESWERGMNDLWAEVNTLHRELKKLSPREDKEE